jgi:hypothetical protein
MARNEYMEDLPAAYWYPEKFAAVGEAFFKAYKLEHSAECPPSAMTGLKPKDLRTCRYCGRMRPFVRFSNLAHIIPELLGNRYLVSDFECDGCNELFGKLESQLANFLGVARTLLSIEGKENIPKFKSTDKQFQMESWVDDLQGVVVEAMRSAGDHSSFQFDEDTGTVTVAVKKHSYQPMAVYKAFLKMALSCIPEEYVSRYKYAFNYLGNTGAGLVAGGFAYLVKYTMSYNFIYEKPAVLIFKKRDPEAALFTHIFVLVALNNIFEIPIPLFDGDQALYGKKISLLKIPPLFSNGYYFPVETILQTTHNLSSFEAVKDDYDSFSFHAPLDQLKVLAYTDTVTGDLVPEHFDPSLIKGVIFSGRYPLPPKESEADKTDK